jgi:hypothetical protein
VALIAGSTLRGSHPQRRLIAKGMLLLRLTLAAAALAGSALASADGFLGLFTGACPTGWSELPAAQGRLLLLVNNTFQAGAAIGFALSDGEDRAHSHAVSGAFDLPSREVSALGGSNTAAAHSGKQPLLPFLNETSAATSGLPFVQLTACRYNALSFAPAPVLPAGGVALWDPSVTTGCAAGSAPLDAASGRLLVVSNSTGLATSAAPPLEPGQGAWRRRAPACRAAARSSASLAHFSPRLRPPHPPHTAPPQTFSTRTTGACPSPWTP